MAALLLLALLVVPAVTADTVLHQMRGSQFSGFLNLLEHADALPEVEVAISSGKALTIFAPTDEALLHHVSPTLLAFLKHPSNKATLRTILLSHFVIGTPSPFHWEGPQATLSGTPLNLALDADAFYAGDVAVSKYNALVSSEASVHALPGLLVPASVGPQGSTLVEEVSEVRRVLQGAAMAPSPDGGHLPAVNVPVTKPPAKENNGASFRSVMPTFVVALAVVAAALAL